MFLDFSFFQCVAWYYPLPTKIFSGINVFSLQQSVPESLEAMFFSFDPVPFPFLPVSRGSVFIH